MVDIRDILSGNKEPVLNDFMALLKTTPIMTTPTGIKDYIKLWKKTPEVISLTNAIRTDILSDGYSFKGADINRKKAMQFAEDNAFDLQLEEFLDDSLQTGNAYFWLGKLKQEQVNEAVSNFMQAQGVEQKELIRRYQVKMSVDEDTYGLRELRVVPSSTMSVIYGDKFGKTVSYKQQVASEFSTFTDKEIIHYTYMKVNGETYGFTPMESIVSEITLLGVLKDYWGNFFANNGTPDYMFVLPNEIVGSPNYANLIDTLKKFKKIENKHGNLVFTGEIKAQQLNSFTKDMEFKNLSEAMLKTLAMVWQVPPARYGATEGKAGDQALANQAYYRNIAHQQSRLEFVLNTQLWKPNFKCEMKFNRSYKEDEIREVTIEKTRTDIVEQRLSLGLITHKAAQDYLSIPEEERADEPKPEPVMKTGKLNNGKKPEMLPEMMQDEGVMRQRKNKSPTKLK